LTRLRKDSRGRPTQKKEKMRGKIKEKGKKDTDSGWSKTKGVTKSTAESLRRKKHQGTGPEHENPVYLSNKNKE